MNKELDKKLKALLPMLRAMQCQQHPAYSATHFCVRPQCGFGFVCEACEELEHASLHHYSMDGLAMDNLLDAAKFIDDVLASGLHYEDKERLVADVPYSDYRLLHEATDKFENVRAKKLKELEDLVVSLQKDVLLRIELRFKKLRKDLTSELNSVFDKETRPLRYLCQALENVYKKQGVAIERLLTELEFAKISSQPDSGLKKIKRPEDDTKLDMQKCSLAFQTYLETTYNHLDIDYMRDARKAIEYLKEAESKVVVDLPKLQTMVNSTLMETLQATFDSIKEISIVGNGGLEDHLGRLNYPDNLGKDISCRYVPAGEAVSKTEVDKRVRIATDTAITAVCTLANKYVVVGFQSGILKVNLHDSRHSNKQCCWRLITPTECGLLQSMNQEI